MNTALSLGPLANAVIDQYGDLARTAVASSVGRRQAACLADDGVYRACTVLGHLFSEDELSLQYLQPGNWVAIGCVDDGARQLSVEINLTTQEIRERPGTCEFDATSGGAASGGAPVAHAIPPATGRTPWNIT